MKYFEKADSWDAARTMISFVPRIPSETLGQSLESLYIHIHDHKRPVPIEQRSLEARYGRFSLVQQRLSVEEAHAKATSGRYGRPSISLRIGPHDGTASPLGPEVDPDDIDGRSAATVAWSDGDMLLVLISVFVDWEDLLRVAESIVAGGLGTRRR